MQAFMIGSNTSLPALSAFSIYAAIGILFDLLLQVTFFAAIMCIDARRQHRRAFDMICCAKSSGDPNPGCCCGLIKGRPKKRPSMRVMGWIGKQMARTPVRWMIVAVWALLLGAGIYGTSQMRVEADVNNFIPEGSYLKEWIRIGQDSFDQTGSTIGVYWVSTPAVSPCPLAHTCAPATPVHRGFVVHADARHSVCVATHVDPAVLPASPKCPKLRVD